MGPAHRCRLDLTDKFGERIGLLVIARVLLVDREIVIARPRRKRSTNGIYARRVTEVLYTELNSHAKCVIARYDVGVVDHMWRRTERAGTACQVNNGVAPGYLPPQFLVSGQVGHYLGRSVATVLGASILRRGRGHGPDIYAHDPVPAPAPLRDHCSPK